MTLATLIAHAAATSEHSGNVALETVGFGIVAALVFTALAVVTMSYRNVANRHSRKAEAYAKAHENDVHHVGHGH